MTTIFGFLYMGAHWRHLKNMTEPFMYGGDAALCRITLTTCYYYYYICLMSVVCFGYSVRCTTDVSIL